MKNCKGTTLLEVLTSFAILSTTGLVLMNFLRPDETVSKIWLSDYGVKLSKMVLLSSNIQRDTVFEHIDVNGNSWKVVCSVSQDENEICTSAYSVRLGKNVTKKLHYCRYGRVNE